MNMRKLLLLIVALVTLICICGCTGAKNDTNANQSRVETPTKNPIRFLVTVVDNDGNPVEGVILELYKDSRVTARTNKNGVATFPLVASNGYKLVVKSCPEGYEYVGESILDIKQGLKEYTLEISKK